MRALWTSNSASVSTPIARSCPSRSSWPMTLVGDDAEGGPGTACTAAPVAHEGGLPTTATPLPPAGYRRVYPAAQHPDHTAEIERPSTSFRGADGFRHVRCIAEGPASDGRPRMCHWSTAALGISTREPSWCGAASYAGRRTRGARSGRLGRGAGRVRSRDRGGAGRQCVRGTSLVSLLAVPVLGRAAHDGARVYAVPRGGKPRPGCLGGALDRRPISAGIWQPCGCWRLGRSL